MAVLRISADALSALEQEIRAISNQSQELNSRLRSATESLSSSWESTAVSEIINKLNETYSAEEQKICLLNNLAQLIEETRKVYAETDSSLAESIRGLFK